ncbi:MULTISPECIES: hypothetical protein [unclassified Moorena]|uniref:hypothetical protein n=1 Tax=unclassified Moorena TaxID=2683338 RepID=UPI0013CC82AF|nr:MULTISPECIES: hypothetical protein [unclassified Moorena]NEO20428.1 hypothetical protein [Moorena sp. SIO4A5]NEQ59963.1 hypothetical protein [Moorena sp. SIO4A1]
MRYGADYPNPGVEAENHRKSAPNAPYARFPIPDSRFPIPYSLLPTPYSLLPTISQTGA